MGNEIGSAAFSNGTLDAEHCTSWSVTKEESDVAGENDETQVISYNYSKELDPAAYQSEMDTEDYYDQFNDVMLSESVTKTVTDAAGNKISETNTYRRGKNRSETVTTYEYDMFGQLMKTDTTSKKYQDGKWLPFYETEEIYTYDEKGNVIQKESKNRKEGENEWQSQISKAEYDTQGNVVKEYTPRGIKENVAVRYEYNIQGQRIRTQIPLYTENGEVRCQTTTTAYDISGNVLTEEVQIDDDRTAKTEYTYDARENLIMVKSHMEDGEAGNKEHSQYVQYVYDVQGNKVRQFTGMTSPLTLTVSEIREDGEVSDKDIFTYGGKTYEVKIDGQKKSDVISETKYEYNEKNELVAFIDPEGRKESYTYDENSNLTETIDKNGNLLRNVYDYQNRLTETIAKEKKTGKQVRHTYTYNPYGEVETEDDTRFEYGDVSGQITRETTKLTKNKDIVKDYTYDSLDNKSTFAVTVGGEIKLDLEYDYDGAARLASVKEAKGNEVVSYTYDENGCLSTKNIPGPQLSTTYAYNYQDCLVGMKNQTEKGGVVSEYHSEYLLNGQKSKETSAMTDSKGVKTTKVATYTYDLLGRLTKETKTGKEEVAYEYDSHNNRKELTVGNKKTAYRYNKNDELLRTDTLNTDTEEDSVVIYKNDKNGNQLATVNRYELPVEKRDGTYVDIDVTLGDNRLNENVVNHYDALDQLTKTLTKNYKVSFTYDAEGLRTSKTVNGEKTVFVWDGDQLVMELSEGGKVKKRYIRGNDLVCTDKGEDAATGKAQGRQYYVMNPHGDVVQLADGSGAVTRAYEYDSFGNEGNPDSKDENPFRYSGEYYDKETGEVYLRARYYQPGLGRFLTRDSYTGKEDDPLSLHLYTYCENDGVNEVDPSGHWSAQKVHKSVTEIIAMGLGFNAFEAKLIGDGCAAADKKGKIIDPGGNTKIKWEVSVENMLFGKDGKMYFDIHALDFSDLNLQYEGKAIKGHLKYIRTDSREAKPNLHTADKKQYKKIKKRAIFSRAKVNKDFERNLVIAGMWLHAIQDRWAHGLRDEELKHGKEADDIMYDWQKKNGKKAYKYMRKYARNGKVRRKATKEMKNLETLDTVKKLVRKNERFNNMFEATYDYLKRMKTSIKKYDKKHFGSCTKPKMIKDQVARELCRKGW